LPSKCPRCQTNNPDTQSYCGNCGTQLTPQKNLSDVTKTIQDPQPTLEKMIAGKYKIIEEIGRGGMGVVYKAEDTKLIRNVALKFLPAELIQDKQAKARFFQEAQTAAAINHPNICIIHEIDEAENQTFIAMEFIKGQTLKERIETSPLKIEEAVKITLKVAEGLKQAHKKGIIHRDIKPANIMLTDKDNVKILDFGIAKISGACRLTHTGTTIGTVAYMSPEQASGEKVDHRTDIWSLGVVLYEMLTGQLPFKGDHEQSVIYSIINEEPESLEKSCKDFPEFLQNAIQMSLQKEPGNRFQTTDEFINTLRTETDSEFIMSEDLSFDIPKFPFQKKKHNLPTQLTSFIGREKEIREVEELLSKNRLVSLIGTGGSGKTRLALQIASDHVDEYKDGVWFIDLAPHNDPKQVAGTTAEVLQISEEYGKPLVDTISMRIKMKHLLLILDNCEHLLKPCAEMAKNLLQTCPALKIMATSREALGIPGEIAWRVPSLTTPDLMKLPDVESLKEEYEAIELFVDRAVGHQPEFRLSSKNAITVAALCAHLDGIPLALELAAARIRQLGPQTILDRLDDRFQILKGSASSTLPRHRTLLATVDWSHDLLTDTEKVLFRRLAVFSGGFVLEAAEAVCASDPLSKKEIVDLLSGLVDKSLVVTDPQGDGSVRYRMLETMRHYAESKFIESGEEQKIHENHFQYFLSLSEEAYARRYDAVSEWLDRLENEHDNLRAALEWVSDKPEVQITLAGALFWFWQAHSYYATGIEYLNNDLLRELSPSPELARACNGAGMLNMFIGRIDEAQEMFDQSHALWLELDNQLEAVAVLLDKGFFLCLKGDYQSGISCFQKCDAILKEHRDERLQLRCKLLLAFGHICQFQPDKAETILKPLLEPAKKFKMPEGISNIYHYYSDCAMLRGDLKEGERRYANALIASLNLGDLFQTAIEMQGMAMCIAGQSRSLKAFRLNAVVMAEFNELGVTLPYVKFWHDSLAKHLDHARGLIGDKAANEAEEEGRKMGFEKAVKYALDFQKD